MVLLLETGGCADAGATFDGVPWGAGAEELPALLSERGYELLMQFDDAAGDQMYAGTFQGHRSLVIARVGEEGLTKVLVGVVAPPDRRPVVYHELSTQLRDRYGAPLVVEGKHAPSASEAVHGSTRVREVWAVGSGAGESYVILEDRPTEGVVLSYESPGWATELERRRLVQLRDTLLGGRSPLDAVTAAPLPASPRAEP